MATFVINEIDIFKYVVSDHDEMTIEESFINGKKLIQRIPINIFRDEYRIIYNALASLLMYERAFSLDSLTQVLMNNKDEILEDEKIELGSDISDNQERFEYILNVVLVEYSDLCLEDVPELTFKGNLELFVENWADYKFTELIHEINLINTSGIKRGNKTIKGRKDADYHYRKAVAIINAIVDADANLLSESIDTSVQTPEEIRDIHDKNESGQENLGLTGLQPIDETTLGIFKGEMTVIQAGSGVGKTRLGLSMVKNILNNGKNVLVISLEQKANRLFSMIQSKHILETLQVSHITDRELIRDSYSPTDSHIVDESRIDLVENRALGRLRIEGKYLKANDLMMELETIWEDFQFDAVMIDYFGLLGTEKNRYNELTDAINLLKSACKSFKGVGFAVIVPNQLTKEGEKELLSGNTETSSVSGSESAYLFRGADTVITLNRTEEMAEDNQLEVIVPKMRLGSVIAPFKVMADLGHCTFQAIEEDEADPFA